MCAPSPPDYEGAAQAQGAANLQTAQAQGRMSNPNVNTPQGSQTVSWGNFDEEGYNSAVTDYMRRRDEWVANNPQHADYVDRYIMRPTEDQFRDPNQATVTQTLNPQEQALYESGLLNRQGLSTLAQTGIQNAQGILGSDFDTSGLPQLPVNPGMTAQNAIMSRLDPQIQAKREAMSAQLANQGVSRGGEAYNRAMTEQNQSENDLYTQAALQGINLDTEASQLAYQRAAYERGLPLNEITALMSGSQIGMPQFQGFQGGGQIQAGNLAGAAQNQGNYEAGAYNANMGGLYGMGAAAIYAMSDRRLKSNIERIGTHPKGFGIYEYDIEDRHEIGVLADEVERVIPEAVMTNDQGYKMVNYGLL